MPFNQPSACSLSKQAASCSCFSEILFQIEALFDASATESDVFLLQCLSAEITDLIFYISPSAEIFWGVC